MKLRLIHIFLLLFLIITMPYEAHAHPGRTDSNGCHYCRTNCAKRGLSNGEYHCHGGGGTSSGSSNSSSSNIHIIHQYHKKYQRVVIIL